MKDFWDHLGAFCLRTLAYGLGCLSSDAAAAAARAAGSVVFFFHRRKRVIYADLKAAFGGRFTEKERWQIVKKHYQHLAQAAVDILRLPVLSRQPVESFLHADVPAEFYPYRDEKKGGIYLTAHAGNWELLQYYVIKGLDTTLTVLARDQKMERTNQVLNDIRAQAGSRIMSTGMGVRGLFRSLRRGEWIGVLGDQDAGKHSGIILRFFGRKTTVPTGAFDLAFRAGVSIFPLFAMRRGNKSLYDVKLYPAIRIQTGTPEEIEKAAAQYLGILEKVISENPEQWLWAVKRWKYSWTKRILILSDGKPGHVKQSEGVAAQFRAIDSQYGRPGMEYPTETLEVRFKSRAHRFMFPWFVLFFLPFVQGRLGALKFFFEKETAEKLCDASADFIISAGSSLAPLNLCLARDNRAKSVVILKPVFPFHLFRYDLALIPAHDEGLIPEKALRILLAPAKMEREDMEDSAASFSSGLKSAERIRWSVFWGGSTRRFKIELDETQRAFEVLDRVARKLGRDYAVTTSRRTSGEIEGYFKKEVAARTECQSMVIAREDTRREVAPGMMAIGQVLIVTEDSVSMISEALRSGKRVVVLQFKSRALPSKHQRFHRILARESAITLTDVSGLEEVLLKLGEAAQSEALAARENEILRKRLQEIL